ncbi:MAG: tRNA (adenosine(37)-N6)-threonylcarbamoyltransferase complex transferase subunit TsaD [Ardenticatenaceae bacterium]|nr:tRNA (adenosine(37)-N6)-threonylcarbamoyltransferase complex transferase subunit TsaD [Ardenticatenaceae bacterium]
MTTRILAIETSCDETGAAVIEDGRRILSNVVASQEAIHAKYGGVFPEVASRRHIEVIYPIIEEALTQSKVDPQTLDAVAVTRGPGLVGSLLVGVNVAKGLALGLNKPLLGINHIEGHIYAQWLTESAAEIEFPIVVLVVSGGHTELYLMTDHLTYQNLGGTLDDAAGEAYDKVGRVLKLPYPGGPAIDKAAQSGRAAAFNFPRAVRREGYDFSFSGLKTAVLREIQRLNTDDLPIHDLSASFQAAVVDVLIEKTVAAAEEFGARAIHLAGGVSANSQLRRQLGDATSREVRFPPLVLCTDNAAMIGAAAHFRFQAGHRGTLRLDVEPGLRLAG